MKAKDVKQLQVWGKEDEVIQKLMATNGKVQPDIFRTDYFAPSQANWSWQIGIAKIGKKHYELLTRFGQVEGGREVYMPEYTLEQLTKEGEK